MTAGGCVGESLNELTAEVPQSITGGMIDGADPAVARLAGGLAVCTGTLVSATVILTAAHCVGPPAPTYATFGPAFSDAAERIPIASVLVHPRFDALQLDNDLALVVVSRRPDASPVPLWDGSMHELVVGTPMRVVGFGRQVVADPDTSMKRSGTARLASLTEKLLTLAPQPSLPCIGDSGGPAFVVAEGREWLAAVTSGGDERCEAFADGTRVDAYAASFIQPFIDDEQLGGDGCTVHGRRDCGSAGACALAVLAALSAWRRAGRARAAPGRRRGSSSGRAVRPPRA